MTKRGWWLVTDEMRCCRARRRSSPVTAPWAASVCWPHSCSGCSPSSPWSSTSSSAIYTLFTQAGSLTFVQLLLIAYAALWVLLTLDTLRLVRLVRTAPNSRGLRSRGRPMVTALPVFASMLTIDMLSGRRPSRSGPASPPSSMML